MRTILIVFFLTSLAITVTGCASALDAMSDALPVTRGEVGGEIAANVGAIAESASSGNWTAAGGSALGALGLALWLGSRMILRRINGYDEAPFEGNGETATEAEIVAATRAVVDRSPST